MLRWFAVPTIERSSIPGGANGRAHGTFHWNELNTRDVKNAKRFYENAIGWTFDGDADAGRDLLGRQGRRQDGRRHLRHLEQTGHGEVPEHWLSYIAVDDVDKRVVKAKKAGATIMREPFDVPGVGRIAILKQPGGAVIGWMTPAPM